MLAIFLIVKRHFLLNEINTLTYKKKYNFFLMKKCHMKLIQIILFLIKIKN